MSHKTFTSECEGESLMTVTCYMLWDLSNDCGEMAPGDSGRWHYSLSTPAWTDYKLSGHLHLVCWLLDLDSVCVLHSSHVHWSLYVTTVSLLSIQVRLRLSSSLLPLSSPGLGATWPPATCGLGPGHSRPGRNSPGSQWNSPPGPETQRHSLLWHEVIQVN